MLQRHHHRLQDSAAAAAEVSVGNWERLVGCADVRNDKRLRNCRWMDGKTDREAQQSAILSAVGRASRGETAFVRPTRLPIN